MADITTGQVLVGVAATLIVAAQSNRVEVRLRCPPNTPFPFIGPSNAVTLLTGYQPIVPSGSASARGATEYVINNTGDIWAIAPTPVLVSHMEIF